MHALCLRSKCRLINPLVHAQLDHKLRDAHDMQTESGDKHAELEKSLAEKDAQLASLRNSSVLLKELVEQHAADLKTKDADIAALNAELNVAHEHCDAVIGAIASGQVCKTQEDESPGMAFQQSPPIGAPGSSAEHLSDAASLRDEHSAVCTASEHQASRLTALQEELTALRAAAEESRARDIRENPLA